MIDDEGRLLGLISRTDALRWPQGEANEAITLAETLSDSSQLSAYPETLCGLIADLIIETGIGRVPIVDADSGKVVGILSRQDLLKARSTHRRSETDRSRIVRYKIA